MTRQAKDEEREERITMEIIVDAYGPEEQALGWYYYLDQNLHFPFSARCVTRRSISPLKPGEKAAILEVVENQLRENNPPETRQTFERLLASGYSRQEAMEMIGSAVVGEIWAVLKENKPYDAVRYRAALDKILEEG